MIKLLFYNTNNNLNSSHRTRALWKQKLVRYLYATLFKVICELC